MKAFNIYTKDERYLSDGLCFLWLDLVDVTVTWVDHPKYNP